MQIPKKLIDHIIQVVCMALLYKYTGKKLGHLLQRQPLPPCYGKLFLSTVSYKNITIVN